MDIVEILNTKTKKDLTKLLKKYSIKYKKRYGDITFSTEINNYDFTVAIGFQAKSINIFRFNMNSEKYDYDTMVENVLTLKDKFILLFGNPKMDNTNHFNKNNISIKFVTEALSLGVTCNNSNEYGSVPYATICVTNINQNLNKNHNYRLTYNLGLWIPSLVGGFLWGLVMYLTMGAKYGYTTSNFIIWMCGGLVFGVAFGLLFPLFNHTNGDVIKKGKVKQEQIIKHFSLENNLVDGNVFTYNTTSPHLFKQRMDSAILKLDNLNVIVYSIIKRKELVLKMHIKNAYYQLLTRKNLNFNRENAFYIFAFDNDKNFNELEHKLFKELINEKEYNILFDELKNITLEYNPYQIYNSNDDSYLDNEISIVTKILLINPEIKHKDLEEMIYVIFGYDEYSTESLTDLYLNAYFKTNNER